MIQVKGFTYPSMIFLAFDSGKHKSTFTNPKDMNKISNLRDLFIEQGRELYNSNYQEIVELPDIERQVTSLELKKIIHKQYIKAQYQQFRIKDLFEKINASPDGEKCEITESIIKKTLSQIRRSTVASVRDAGIISLIQMLNHRKIAGLGSLTAYAREIDQEQSAKSLHEALVDEKEIDEELSELAENEINKMAKTAIFA